MQEDFINLDVYKSYNLLLLQEPYIDGYGNTKATKDWRVTYPSCHLSLNSPVRSVILVSANLDTNNWAQLTVPGSNDLTSIQFKAGPSLFNIFNIYNDCHHNASMEALDMYLKACPPPSHSASNRHMLWCGDFNQHHPLWHEERNHHLFTAAAIRATDTLLETVADHGMLMILPHDIPTLEAKATKNWTRPDNVFCSAGAEELVVTCDTDPRLRGPGADHVPILTTLELPLPCTESSEARNFRLVDWGAFRESLEGRLANLSPTPLTSEAAFQAMVAEVTAALQDTIRTSVPLVRPSPHSKR